MPQPQVVFAFMEDASGLYCRPQMQQRNGVDQNQGIIVVSTIVGDSEVGNVIAHEWRHHYQEHHGMLPYEAGGMSDWDAALRRLGYWRAVRRHFLHWPHEMDALVFSHRANPSDLSDRFLGAVRGSSTWQ